MRAVGAIARKLDDWVNPIAVKELRQAVQARLIAGLLLLFLLGLLVTTMALASDRGQYGYDSEGIGGGVFIVLYGILLGTCVGLVPAYCGGRLMAERSGAHADLLFATALRPRAIVWGKFSAGLILIVLIYSACAPFLTLTYLLRGIDMSVIFLLLGVGLALSALSLACTVFLACVPASNLLRGLLGLVWLGVTFVVLLYVVRLARAFIDYGGGLMMREVWEVCSVLATFALMVTVFLFLASVTLMSPPSANRILPVRVYVTIAWLLTALAVYFTLGLFHLARAWATFCVFVLSCGLLVAVSERDQVGPRVARAIPRSPLLRPFAFVFYTGSAGGLVWSCLMIALTLLAWHHLRTTTYMMRYPAVELDEATQELLGMATYALAYAMTGYLLQRSLFRRTNTGQTWMLALCIAALAFLPPLGAHLFELDPFGDRGTSSLWALGTPMLVFDEDYRAVALTFSLLWATAAFMFALPRLWRQVGAFKPLARIRHAAAHGQAVDASPAVVEAPVEAEAEPS
ncbi:MAG: hypothetical protein JW889_10670 [Verrucomicrobia bacterium]|nr:hypothetical protein [Verrucomicrobiota bacterium]